MQDVVYRMGPVRSNNVGNLIRILDFLFRLAIISVLLIVTFQFFKCSCFKLNVCWGIVTILCQGGGGVGLSLFKSDNLYKQSLQN